MSVVTTMGAACYVEVLLPFEVAVVISGSAEIRLDDTVPILLSLLFGPAVAFGAGFCNIIADILGSMMGPVSIFGFLGNFLYGLHPLCFVAGSSWYETHW